MFGVTNGQQRGQGFVKCKMSFCNGAHICINGIAYSLTNIFSAYVDRYFDVIIYAKRGKKYFEESSYHAIMSLCGMGWKIMFWTEHIYVGW